MYYNLFLSTSRNELKIVQNPQTLAEDTLSVGEPVDKFAIDTFKKHFNVLIQYGYGQTECTLIITTIAVRSNIPCIFRKYFPWILVRYMRLCTNK